MNARARSPWLLFLLTPLHAWAATLEGKVIKVADGDTITILVGTEQHRIRLHGIDARNESNHSEGRQDALCQHWWLVSGYVLNTTNVIAFFISLSG